MTLPRTPVLSGTSASVIVPTYKEVLNIPLLLERLKTVRDTAGLDLEVLIMDDASRDGSVEAVQKFGAPWAKIIERTGLRGLSPAVVEGLERASKDMVVVMDADLSHPPETIPEMLRLLTNDADFVLGSRYVEGGSTDDDWGFLRWINSQVATLLARPLTTLQDPMSGFFAMRRADIQFHALNPVGYKIGLELVVKCRSKQTREVPIHFSDRALGESKLTLKEQLRYLQHLRRLYIFRFAGWAEVIQFAAVGGSGVAVNLITLTLLLQSGFSAQVSVATGIAVSIVTNFLLNRRFTFSYARSENIFNQFLGFVLASSAGAVVNYFVAMFSSDIWPSLPLQVHSLVGIAAGLGLNFLANRFIVFRKRFIRPRLAGQAPESRAYSSPPSRPPSIPAPNKEP